METVIKRLLGAEDMLGITISSLPSVSSVLHKTDFTFSMQGFVLTHCPLFFNIFLAKTYPENDEKRH